jgi:hypothetical protein
MSQATETNRATILRRSFCGKGQHDVRELVAGPHVFICDEMRGVIDGGRPR